MNAFAPVPGEGFVKVAIVVPGHRVSQALPPVARRQIRASGGSPMGDYTDTMTIRQLVDLIAYLQSIVR